MKFILFFLLSTGVSVTLQAQRLISKSGFVKFYSYTAIEEIEANTNQAASILDVASGTIQVSLLIRSLSFKKELMQEHFNENYMESDKYPKATFKGTITNLKEIDFNTDGEYIANLHGDMTIHGVTKSLDTIATLSIKKGETRGKSEKALVWVLKYSWSG